MVDFVDIVVPLHKDNQHYAAAIVVLGIAVPTAVAVGTVVVLAFAPIADAARVEVPVVATIEVLVGLVDWNQTLITVAMDFALLDRIVLPLKIVVMDFGQESNLKPIALKVRTYFQLLHLQLW
ncbi:hypothetical protein [Evansella tamaricis]|uniref:Uncharacterized protein n=1 Tax=Evansella tamaricis TaxID=2069301 RepID=A0ABS6JEQ0_9BACI|nr:hypothetical protein [Evansella tamaricis]MBU9712137.1 hypothetical protein [Evansella tamaricis]